MSNTSPFNYLKGADFIASEMTTDFSNSEWILLRKNLTVTMDKSET